LGRSPECFESGLSLTLFQVSVQTVESSVLHKLELLSFLLGLREYDDLLVSIIFNELLDLFEFIVDILNENGFMSDPLRNLGGVVSHEVNKDGVFECLGSHLLNEFRDCG
jgi:hypothetical protein